MQLQNVYLKIAKISLKDFIKFSALKASDINRSHVQESAKLKQIASPGNDRVEEEIDASKAFRSSTKENLPEIKV